VAAADAILCDEPLGSVVLFTSLDPTNIVEVADDIRALPHTTPTYVLDKLADGESPYSVVAHGIWLTPLDPSRASLDLLEDLPSGIDGGWIIFKEHTDTGDVYGGEKDEDDEDAIDEAREAWEHKTLSEFRELVRRQAQLTSIGLE
jgi:hypothetical protein